MENYVLLDRYLILILTFGQKFLIVFNYTIVKDLTLIKINLARILRKSNIFNLQSNISNRSLAHPTSRNPSINLPHQAL